MIWEPAPVSKLAHGLLPATPILMAMSGMRGL